MNRQHLTASAQQWQTVWQRHSGWLRTVLLARLRDPAIVDEVLQDVAVTAWRRLEQLEDPNKIEPWLYRIAIRRVLGIWREQKRAGRECELPDHFPDTGCADPLEWMTSREIHGRVQEAMNELGQQDREILMLRHTEGWTYQQIAERIGMTIDKVIYRLARARKRLRQRLQLLEQHWLQK